MITFTVQNLKCGGCANTITKGVQSIEGVSEVNVNVEESTVSFQTISEEVSEKVKQKLLQLGYPTEDQENTFIRKAVSYISCATGKM